MIISVVRKGKDRFILMLWSKNTHNYNYFIPMGDFALAMTCQKLAYEAINKGILKGNLCCDFDYWSGISKKDPPEILYDEYIGFWNNKIGIYKKDLHIKRITNISFNQLVKYLKKKLIRGEGK